MRRELDAKRVLLSEGLKHLNAPHVAKRTMFGLVMASVHSFLHHSFSVPYFFWAQKHLDSVYLPKPDFSSRFYCCARNDPQGSCRTQWCKLSLAGFFLIF